jgi:3-phosphoshikimate 1-carboxyvinyltransferase
MDALAQPGMADRLGQLAATLPVRFEGDRVLLDGQDVSDAVRTEAAGMAASRVSACPQVRHALLGCNTAFAPCPAWWPTAATWAP